MFVAAGWAVLLLNITPAYLAVNGLDVAMRPYSLFFCGAGTTGAPACCPT
jgi:hypothetical protein